MRSQFSRTWLLRENRLLMAVCIVAVIALVLFVVARSAGAAEATSDAAAAASDPNALTLIVMDPLALPLSCPCVQGYAQRDYDKLAAALKAELGRDVKVVYNESLPTALKGNAEGKADIVIGKHSVVLFDAKRTGQKLSPVAKLPGKDGSTTMTGLIVVPKDDPAQSVSQLAGYRIVFGPEECDEKHKSALALLKQNGVTAPAKLETSPACSDGACWVLDDFKADKNKHGAAVISSYAKPLLEGCGTVEKGALRLVGETAPVPFIEAFLNEKLPAAEQAKIAKALVKVTADPELRIALETRDGFVAMPKNAAKSASVSTPAGDTTAAKKKVTSEPSPSGRGQGEGAEPAVWPSWRGPNRNGIVPWLPERLPEQPKIVWRKRLTQQALAGLAANDKFVIVADRDPLDTQDIFRCLRADNGDDVWTVRNVASGNLDYGNSSRATPLIHGELVFLYNAFGRLQCVRLETGEMIWKKDLLSEFGGRDENNAWGTTSSPLVVDGKLIVNPGGPQASLVALKPETGDVIWKTPGDHAAFGSLIVGTFGGKRQLVGHDKHAICGWDVETGKQRWRLIPPRESDFNVPTPIQAGEQLLVTTENNGTRLYKFDAEGRIVPQPVAINEDLAPDTHSPVAVGKRLFGVWDGLHCLDLTDGLKALWIGDGDAFNDYAAIVAAANRVLVISKYGELLLIDPAAVEYRLISKLSVFDDDPGVYSHPAFVGRRMFLRGSQEIVCLDLDAAAQLNCTTTGYRGCSMSPAQRPAVVRASSVP